MLRLIGRQAKALRPIAFIPATVLALSSSSAFSEGWVVEQFKKGGHFVEKKAHKLGIAVRKFSRNPVNYTLNLPASVISDVCSIPARAYEQGLRAQAHGRWTHLPEKLIWLIQDEYAVNLSSVVYSQRINTGGDAVTFGPTIYFPRDIDLTQAGDVHWMLHELEHVVQFRGGTYGEAGKLCEYEAKMIGTLSHDKIDMERAADRKADRLVQQVMNGLNEPDPFLPGDHEIIVVNDTDNELRYGLETATIQKTMMTIPPHTLERFAGTGRDDWFNIYLGDNQSVGVDHATCQHLNYDANGWVQVTEIPVVKPFGSLVPTCDAPASGRFRN